VHHTTVGREADPRCRRYDFGLGDLTLVRLLALRQAYAPPDAAAPPDYRLCVLAAIASELRLRGDDRGSWVLAGKVGERGREAA